MLQDVLSVGHSIPLILNGSGLRFWLCSVFLVPSFSKLGPAPSRFVFKVLKQPLINFLSAQKSQNWFL